MAETTEAATSNRIWDEKTLESLPGGGYVHEFVDGEPVTSPKKNSEHGDICMGLSTALMNHVVDHKLGVIVESSTGSGCAIATAVRLIFPLLRKTAFAA